MQVEQRIIAQGVDSWEAEMLCQGTTFKVEAMLELYKEREMWRLEVLHQRKWSVQLMHFDYYPTLDVAVQEAKRIIEAISSGNKLK